MKNILLVILAICSFAFAQVKQTVAIVDSESDVDSIGQKELDDLTREMRNAAHKVFDGKNFVVLSKAQFIERVGGGDMKKYIAECRASGSCLADLGKKGKANYVAQGKIISNRNDELEITVELWKTNFNTTGVEERLGYLPSPTPPLDNFEALFNYVKENVADSVFKKALIVPTGIEQPKGSSNALWAVAANVVGLGLAAVGYWQNSEYKKRHEDYVSLPEGREQSEYKSAWEKVESAKTMRNAMYISGGVLFSVGVVLWVF
jgi:hypothetical protein